MCWKNTYLLNPPGHTCILYLGLLWSLFWGFLLLHNHVQFFCWLEKVSVISFATQECYNSSKVLFLLSDLFHCMKVSLCTAVSFKMLSPKVNYWEKKMVIIGWRLLLYLRFPYDCTLFSKMGYEIMSWYTSSSCQLLWAGGYTQR